jgi:hypothetical protein
MKKGDEGFDKFGRGVLLDEVTGPRNEPQLCARDARREFVALGHGDPGILRAPTQQDWDVDRSVPILDLVGVALVGLDDLAVEG